MRQVYNLTAGRTLFEQAAAAFERAGDATRRSISLAICYRMLGAQAEARQALAKALAGPLPPAERGGTPEPGI